MEAAATQLVSGGTSLTPALPQLRARPLFTIGLVLAIVAVDWVTPAGVAVGILLSIPIFLACGWDDPSQVWITTSLAIVGFILAATFGEGPIAPAAVWVPNRIITLLSLPTSGAIALMLQRRRIDAVRGLHDARGERDLNRLLMSLLAHDLRSPLSVAEQGFKYVEESLSDGRPVDTLLLADVRARMRRSLRAIDVVLTLARADLAESQAAGNGSRQPIAVGDELAAEVNSFREEAAAQGKQVILDVEDLHGTVAAVDGLVLRQAVAILVDNAVRHASPGAIRVSAQLSDSSLSVRVADSGPGLSAHQAQGSRPTRGSGLGLELCRLLVARAGGSLEVENDSPEGTRFLLRLPAPHSPW